jgi:hypothetical protein
MLLPIVSPPRAAILTRVTRKRARERRAPVRQEAEVLHKRRRKDHADADGRSEFGPNLMRDRMDGMNAGGRRQPGESGIAGGLGTDGAAGAAGAVGAPGSQRLAVQSVKFAPQANVGPGQRAPAAMPVTAPYRACPPPVPGGFLRWRRNDAPSDPPAANSPRDRMRREFAAIAAVQHYWPPARTVQPIRAVRERRATKSTQERKSGAAFLFTIA